MNALSFSRRLLFFLLSVLLVDSLGRVLLESRLLQVSSQQRLPNNQETGFLPGFLDRLQQDSRRPRIVFLGSSPTYGVTIKEESHTYPASFAQALKKSHPQSAAGLSVYNLAAKGFLAADLNSILKASLPDAEGLVIQLNYHTFAPKLLAGTPIRHPDLPERLGAPVSLEEAKKLGLRPTPLLNWNAAIRAQLRKFWWFYGHREQLALLSLGSNPENWFYQLVYPDTAQAAEENAESTPFYELKPARQTTIVQRYAQNASFELDEHNTELFFVRQMLAQLKASGKPAVFFIAPINVEALKFYEVMDWKQYARNLRYLRQLIEQAGFSLIDVNESDKLHLGEEYFADISHTLDAGGQLFGARLWELSRKSFEDQLGL